MLSIKKIYTLCHREPRRNGAWRFRDYLAVLAMMVAVIVIFAVPVGVNAQACPPGSVSCGGACVAPASSQGNPCSGSGGRVGTIDECGACTNLVCQSGQTFCSGACQPTAAVCPSGSNRGYDSCTGCGGCAGGFTDCETGVGYNCQTNTSASCPSPRVYNPCTGSCVDAYVLVNPASAQSGFFNIIGNGTIGGNLAVGTGFIFPSGAPSGSLITAGNVYANAIYSRLSASSPDNLWIGDNNDIVQVQGGIIVGGNMGIGVTSPLSKLDIAGDVRWTGILQGGFVPWARLTGFPLECPSGQYISAIGGGLTCSTPASAGSGGLSGTGTGKRLAKFTGATTLGNSIITETSSGTINVAGSITATSCFGPVYQGQTTGGPYDGLRGGYGGVNALCSVAVQGSHVCTATELLNSINCGVAMPTAGLFAWVSNGLPGFTAPAVNDCQGWKSNAGVSYGAMWDFENGRGLATSCSTSHQFACCK